MKKVLLLSLLIVCLFVSCQTVGRFDVLHVGMTKEEVLETFGKPSSKGVEKGREYYVYNNNIDIGFWKDSYIDYKIVFENDKVIEYGQLSSHVSNDVVYVYHN